MSAGGPRGRTTRRPLAGLHAGTSLLHGSEEGATAGRTPASAKVAAFDQPAGARIPWSIARPPGVDSVSAPDASPSDVEPIKSAIRLTNKHRKLLEADQDNFSTPNLAGLPSR